MFPRVHPASIASLTPTPPQHYVHPSGSDGLYLVVDEKSNFREDNFQKAIAEMSEAAVTDTKRQGEGWCGCGHVGWRVSASWEKVVRRSMGRGRCDGEDRAQRTWFCVGQVAGLVVQCLGQATWLAVRAYATEKEKKGSDARGDIHKIVRMIMERNYDPVIVFAFSKRRVEALAGQTTNLDLNSDEEKRLVEVRGGEGCADEEKRLVEVKRGQ